MGNTTLLHILMVVHTLIAAASTAALVYLYYAAWKGRSPRTDMLLLAALIWPFVNLALLLANGWECPMQSWAKALTGEHTGWVRDMYFVPQSWMAFVPWTYGPFYLFGAALVFGRALARARASARVRPRHRA